MLHSGRLEGKEKEDYEKEQKKMLERSYMFININILLFDGEKIRVLDVKYLVKFKKAKYSMVFGGNINFNIHEGFDFLSTYIFLPKWVF